MTDLSFRSELAELDWSEDGLPFSVQFQDIYYSRGDALGESNHVFVQGNALEQRWSVAPAAPGTFVVAELGFGAGLNFLLTWRRWQEQGARHPGWRRLHYLAFERYPLRADDMQRLHLLWPQLTRYSRSLLDTMRSDCSGRHRFVLDKTVCLDLIIGDASTELARRSSQDNKVDAWFLDGFSPGKNPRLWHDDLFYLMAQHSAVGGTVATYSCAGSVRRGLQKAGFDVSKETGFSNKRHMLCGRMASSREIEVANRGPGVTNPWYLFPRSRSRQHEAVVIGAGLAGCHVAHSLARRDWRVRVVDAGNKVAAGASGIPQLALRCRLFNQADVPARFFVEAYCYASGFYQRLQADGDCGWHSSGLFQSDHAVNKRKALCASTLSKLYPDSVVHTVDSDLVFGSGQNQTGYWFERGGWADPVILCTRLLDSPHIQLSLNQSVSSLRRNQDQWQLLDQEGEIIESAETVVLACGDSVMNFIQARALQYELTVGQCTVVKPNEAGGLVAGQMRSVWSGERTLFPANHDTHTIAASYRKLDASLLPQAEDDRHNLEVAAQLLDGRVSDFHIVHSPVGIRANTRDRIPTIGHLPDFEAMEGLYGELSRNAKAKFSSPGVYHQGLYISAGHGSNGLASCPLAGEYLASLINGDCLPLDQEVMDALNPCRFLIQDLKKQRLQSG